MGVKNISNSATTIKSMYDLLPSDTWSIDRCITFCCYDGKANVQDECILDKYYHYLEQYVIEIDLDQKYYYNPQLFAKDYYGEAELDFLVLYFAQISSLYEFNTPKIKVLDYSHLQDINKIFTAYKKDIDESKEHPQEVYAKDISDISTSAKYI